MKTNEKLIDFSHCPRLRNPVCSPSWFDGIKVSLFLEITTILQCARVAENHPRYLREFKKNTKMQIHHYVFSLVSQITQLFVGLFNETSYEISAL